MPNDRLEAPDVGPLLAGRATGMLLGLAAGDRNGGPIQMGLALAERLAADHAYDPIAVLKAYHSWWREGEGIDAWDTGPIAARALRSAPELRTVADAERVASAIDESLRGKTAGANAVHRVPPFAACAFLPDDLLPDIARQESRMTHWSPISQATCAVTVVLCRRLLRGEAWDDALQALSSAVPGLAPDAPAVQRVVRAAAAGEHRAAAPACGLDAGGFCIAVLEAALRFVDRAPDFGAALRTSIDFAGPDNYCPVLVGALAGARFGAQGIGPAYLAHCRPQVPERCRQVAMALLVQRTGGVPTKG